MCPKTNPKSSPASIGLGIRPEQFLSCKKQECHCVPGNNDPATFTSHQICLSPLELWNRSHSQLRFQRESEKGRVTGRCPCWLWSWLQEYLLFSGVCSDKSLLCICTQLESRMICILWHGHKNGHMDCFEGSESCFVSANWSS